jgi:glycosyltransferase involved in cell wall biosynthesis
MMEKSKYLIITEVFYPESFLVNELVAEWNEQGYDVEVLTKTPSYPFGRTFEGYKNKLYQKNDFNGVKVHRVPIVKGYASNVVLKILNYICFFVCGSIACILMGRRYKKIFVYQTGPLTVAIPAIISKVFHRRDVIVYTQDVWPDTVYAYGFKKRRLFDWALKGFVKWIYKNTDIILVSSKGFINKIQAIVPAKPVVYVPNWSLVKSTGHEAAVALSPKMNFMFAGNIGKVQNLENVLRGFHLFNREKRMAALHIVGDGSHLNNIEQLTREEKIEDVVFWGRQPIENMPGFLKASDVLIISLIDKPIFELTVPSKFQAYIAYGKPIFGVISGETADLIKENDIGVCASPASISEIADAFHKLSLQPKEELDRYGRNAASLYTKEFEKSKLIKKITLHLTGTAI